MKIGFVSLGCPKNLVDSEVMLGLAEQAGHEITTEAEGADVLVVNTCAFIDRAKQESIDTILEMAELKKQVPGRKLIVTGCMAERYRDELRAEIPEIDAVLGTGEVTGLVGRSLGSRESRAGRRLADDLLTPDPPRAARSSPTPDSRLPTPDASSESRLPTQLEVSTPGRSRPSSASTCPPTSTTRPRPAGAPRPVTTPT